MLSAAEHASAIKDSYASEIQGALSGFAALLADPASGAVDGDRRALLVSDLHHNTLALTSLGYTLRANRSSSSATSATRACDTFSAAWRGSFDPVMSLNSQRVSQSPRAASATARPPIRVVLADDAYLARVALGHLLAGADALVLVGECDDARSVVEMVDRQRADVLITDIRMPPSGQDEGIRLAARLRRTHPALGVIVLSTYADVVYALKLLESGCDSRGYLLKDRIRDRAQILDAVQTVAGGGSVIDPTIVEDLVKATAGRRRSPLEQLTPRELETLALVAEGQSNAAIAESLVLTKRAVEKHVNAIFAKLDLGEPDHVSRRVKAVLVYLADRGTRPAVDPL